MPEEVVKYRAANAIATITLNRPEKANTLRMEVIELLDQFLARANSDPEIKVIILEGVVPAMDEVGRRFETGDFFLPEMMAAALGTRGAENRSPLIACGILLSVSLAFGCTTKEQSKQESEADTSTVDASKAVAAPTPTQESSSTRDFEPSPVKYDKRTLRSNYMAAPANALAIGRIGANKGKLLLACAFCLSISLALGCSSQVGEYEVQKSSARTPWRSQSPN